jgi:hypothetical protein
LLRAAREGAVKLFAASHVLEEVREKAPTQERRGVDAGEMLELFERTYLPEVRFVDVSGIGIARRAVAVAEADPDDLATAQLALLLAPCHVYTDDPDLIDAGFGQGRNWLGLVQSAQRAMEVDRAALMIAELAKAAWGRTKPWLARNARESTAGEVLVGVGIGFALLMLLPPVAQARLGDAIAGGGRVLAGAGELTASAGVGLLGERARHGGYLARTAVAPDPAPTLEQKIARELALGEGLSAPHLAASLGISVGALESTLHSFDCFVYEGRGWWLGRRGESLGSVA